MRVAVTCGYATSLHAIALIHRLAQEGHEVALCLRVRVLSKARARFYLRQLGWRGFRRKLVNRLFPQRAQSLPAGSDETTPMLEYLAEHGIASRNISAACRSVGAREIVVGSLNDASAICAIRQTGVELVVYGGGGILSQEFLDAPPRGVLNTHGGPLPQFRGMNAGEWALFYGVRPAMTAHMVVRELDLGPTLFQQDVPVECWHRGIAYGRGVCARSVVEADVAAVRLIQDGSAKPCLQRPDDGRTFPVMAPPLLEVLERWIAEERTPTLSPAEFHFSPSSLDG